MNSQHGEFMNNVNDTGVYNDDVVKTMHDAIKAFKETQTY